MPLGSLSADHDSGRYTGQRDFYQKDASFRRVPYLRFHRYAIVEHPYGVLNTKLHPLGGDSLLYDDGLLHYSFRNTNIQNIARGFVYY